MRMIKSCSNGLLWGFLLIVGMTVHASSGALPWYVNPTVKAKVGVGAETFTAPALRLSADGDWLGFSATTEAGGRIAAFRMADLAALDAADTVTADAGISAATADLGLGDGAFGFIPSGTLGAAVAWNSEGIARALPNGALTYRAWTKRFKPVGATVNGAAETVVLDGKGTGAWSVTDGALVRWSVSGNALTGSLTLTKSATTVATGLGSITDFAIYTIGGSDYALVGNGTTVALVNLASGARQTLLSDLASPIVAVRLSHANDFRPRLYVLTEAGDLTVYVFAADALEIDATWTKTLSADDILALAGAKVAAFDVSADGATLVLATAAGGSLAVVRHEPKVWCYTKDEDGSQFVSDGNWKLRCWDEWGNVIIGTDWETQNAYATDHIGEYLDFSSGYATNSTTGGKMKILGHINSALGATENGGPRVVVISPEATVDTQFTSDWKTVEEIVLAANGLSSIHEWTLCYPVLRRLVLKASGLVEIKGNAFLGVDCYPLGATDVSNWDLSTLKTVGYAFWNTGLSGCLSLPVVETLADWAFGDCHSLHEARLGETSKSVKSIGANVLIARDMGAGRAVGRLKRLVIGGADGFTVGANAFGGQPLEEVVFTGGVPAFADGFRFADAAARTVFFAVPRGDAAWETALAGKVTPLSDAERRAIQKANPDRPMPFGVVAADAFRTVHEQYVCDVAEAARCRVTVEHDAFFGDAVEVSSDLAPGSDGSYAAGTTLTLTPKPSATGTFHKWYGDVPNGMCAETPLTLVVSNDTWVLARFTHPWTLSEDLKTASNGNFTINVTVKDGNRALGLGNGTAHGLFADSDEGVGTLDLGGDVLLPGDGTPWTFVVWEACGSLLVRERNGKGAVTTLFTPGTLTDLSWAQLFAVDESGQASYRTVVFDEPKMGGLWCNWNGHASLTRLILQTPSLTAAFDQNYAFWGMPLSETKLDWWNLPRLASLASQAWANDYGRHMEASGTLRLPSLCVVQKEALAWMPNVEAVELGGRKRRTYVTEIGARAFAHDPRLRSLRVHNAAGLTVGEAPFEGGSTPREIVFTGPAVADNGEAFAALTSGVEAAETKPVVICVSALMWSGTPYIDTAVSEAERAQLPGEEILGVYRGGAEAPLGKALVVKRPSPFDPRGIAVVIR